MPNLSLMFVPVATMVGDDHDVPLYLETLTCPFLLDTPYAPIAKVVPSLLNDTEMPN